MSIPVLTTKLNIPPSGKYRVDRPHLTERLNACLQPGCRLMLVSAPAGFGKTTLVTAWAATLRELENLPAPSIAWLSLDDGDNDLIAFWTYLISALQTQVEGLGQQALAALQPPQPPGPEAVLTPLVNDLAQISHPFLLILDDYHLIHNPVIHHWLSLFIEHAPAQFHIIIVTRTDPPLPLGLLRGRGQFLELRLADLRFSTAEAAEYLNEGMKLALPPTAIDTLNTKTEGWAAGLQLAALALQGLSSYATQDTTGFIQAFSSSNRYILEYLLEEVLSRQTEDVQKFLLHTSILDRLCGPLCDAVLTPSLNSQSMLESLEHANLFLISLDQEQCWYRYHHLFADLLQKRLGQLTPEYVPVLHARASAWYEQAGLLSASVEHAFLARDDARAASLLDRQVETFWGQGAHTQLLEWLSRLPEEQISRYPNLGVYQAAIYAANGNLNQAEQALQALENHPDILSPSESLAGMIAAVRTLIAATRGNTADTIRYAQFAIDRLPKEHNSAWRAYLLLILSNVYMVQGNLDAATQNLVDAVRVGKSGGNAFIVLDAMTKLIMVLWVRGNLRQANQYCQEGLAFIEQHDLAQTQAAGILMLGWAFILYERNELDQAETFLSKGMDLCRVGNSKTALAWAYQVQILYLVARGDLIAAEAAALEANRLVQDGEIPIWLRCGITGLLSGVYLRMGKISEAEQVLRSRQITSDGDIEHPYQTEYFSLARLFLLKGELEPASQLLDRLLDWARTAKQVGWMIAIQISRSLVYQARGDHRRALETFDDALALGEPEGYIQTFLDPGKEQHNLLAEAARRGAHREYARRLLAVIPGSTIHPPQGEEGREINQRLRDPLSEREMQVVQWIAAGLTNKEIAQKLCVSVRTVKYYSTSIFTKLDVNGRAQAAIRARELEILK